MCLDVLLFPGLKIVFKILMTFARWVSLKLKEILDCFKHFLWTTVYYKQMQKTIFLFKFLFSYTLIKLLAGNIPVPDILPGNNVFV